jgi:hypothetical protein
VSEGPTPTETVLILPLNVAAVMPPELETLGPFVWEELELHLRAHDKALKTVAPVDARRLWRRSVEDVRSRGKGVKTGYDDATRALVLELTKHAKFDTVIVPSLFIREARISGGTASWDGVERPLEIAGNGVVHENVAPDAPLMGVAPAASLHAVVLDGNGDKLHEAVGGLTLLVRVREPDAATAATGELEWVVRSDLHANRVHLREGIEIALAPFLTSREGKADPEPRR